jgi:hypothetical protein
LGISLDKNSDIVYHSCLHLKSSSQKEPLVDRTEQLLQALSNARSALARHIHRPSIIHGDDYDNALEPQSAIRNTCTCAALRRKRRCPQSQEG